MQLPSDPAQVYATFFTAMFLHGGWMHLAMNMWMLWIFGNNVEDRLGRFMYFCFYLVGGIVGTICQYLSDPDERHAHDRRERRGGGGARWLCDHLSRRRWSRRSSSSV